MDFSFLLSLHKKDMEQILAQIWPHLLTITLTYVAIYVGIIHALRERVSLLEAEMKRIERRVDSHSGKMDEILKAVNEVRVDIGKITTVLNIVETKSK